MAGQSNQFYLCSPISQTTNLPQWALQYVQHTTPSIDPQFRQGKPPPVNPLTRKTWKKPQEVQQRHAIDVVNKPEFNNSLQIQDDKIMGCKHI